MKQDNTVGSRSQCNLAYIAGFLDGDGSLMLQIKKRSDGRSKLRFMCTICFYQDSRHEVGLVWIRKILGIGYLSRRKDGMSELRINGFAQVKEILGNLLPYIRFKQQQAKALYGAAHLLGQRPINHLTERNLRKLVKYIITIQTHNYATKSKRNESELLGIVGLTP